MKNLLLISFYFSLFTALKAQSLVPNPSFEEKNNCPFAINQLNYTKYWFDPFPPTCDQAEYYNSCDTISPIDAGVPQNRGGYQYAHTGNAYSGIYLFWLIYNNFSEYIEVKLTDTLIANENYCVSFYVSLADSERYAIDAIEAYISKDSTSDTLCQTLPYHPQISNYGHGIISDKTNWHLISGNFIAQGGEKYITIGNFRLKDSINYMYVGGGIEDLAYYYIDDVSVYPCNAPVYAAGAGNNVTICKGDSVQIGAAPHAQYLYSWQPTIGLSDTAIANPWAKPTVTTTYYLKQKDFKFDVTTDSVTVTVNPLPIVTLSALPDTICNESSSTLTAGGASTYSWTNPLGTGNPKTVLPSATTTYIVTGVDSNECSNTASITIIVKLCEDTTEDSLTIPNAFIPDEDGVNSVFKAKGQNIKTFHGIIINRWGQKLYEWNALNGGWDGKYKGNDVAPGAYFFVITVTFNDGTTEEKKGSVEVVRNNNRN